MRRAALVVPFAVAALTFPFVANDEREGVGTGDRNDAFDRERAAAEAVGLVPEVEQCTTERAVAREVTLTGRRCVAFVVAVSGPDLLQETEIRVDGLTVAIRYELHGLAHAATCVARGGRVELSYRLADGLGPSEVRYAILTGPLPARPEAYPALVVDPLLFRDAAVDAVRERAEALLGGPARVSAVLSPGAAALLPPSTATFAARRALSGSTRSVPRVRPIGAELADPFAAPTDVEAEPALELAAGRTRLLAVLDAGALAASLGASCLEVLFVRPDEPTPTPPIWSVNVATLEEHTVEAVDGAIARDRLCPAAGLFSYGTPQDAGGDVELRVGVLDPPPGTPPPPTPSAFAGGPVVLPRVRALDARCRGGDDDACLDLAGFAGDGAAGAGDPRTLLEGVCTRRGGRACALLGPLVAASGRPRDVGRAGELERRACGTGDLDACLRRAATFRERGELASSWALYRFACDRGSSAACDATRLFTEWELVRDFPAAPGPELLP